jgi:N-acetyl-gamma-glutamylphosphate reductase
MYTLTSVENSFNDRGSSSSIGSLNLPGCYKQAITNSWWVTANSVSKFQKSHQRIHNFLQHNFSAGGYIQQKRFTNILKKRINLSHYWREPLHTHIPEIQQHLYASPPRLYQILDAIPSHRLLSSNDLTWALFHSCFILIF